MAAELSYILFAVGCLFIFYGMLMLHLAVHQKQYPGYGEWVAAVFLLGIGMVLNSQKTDLPSDISILLAILMACFFFILLSIGLVRFANQPPSYFYMGVLTFGCMVVILYLTVFHNSMHLRGLSIAAFLCLLSFRCGLVAYRATKNVFESGINILTMCLFGCSIVFFLRFIGIANTEPGIPFDRGYDAITLVLLCFLGLGIITGLLILNFARLTDELEHSSERYRNLFESSRDAVMILDNDVFVNANIAALDLFGCWTYAEFVGKRFQDFSPAVQPAGERTIDAARKRISQALNHGSSFFEWQHVRMNGSLFYAEVMLSALPWHGKTHLQAMVRDVSHRKKLEEKLEHLASTDSLTGADNRRSFFQKAEKELRHAERCTYDVSLLMLDIDHFKKINDAYGHQAGDDVLRALCKYCTSSLRESDVFGRLGGEEFAFLLSGADNEEAVQVAERLRDGCAQMVVVSEGRELQFTVSIGIATRVSLRMTVDQLIADADAFLYKAKELGRNRVEYCRMAG